MPMFCGESPQKAGVLNQSRSLLQSQGMVTNRTSLIFKYFEDINMLLPIETKFDLDKNIVYTEVDSEHIICDEKNNTVWIQWYNE